VNAIVGPLITRGTMAQTLDRSNCEVALAWQADTTIGWPWEATGIEGGVYFGGILGIDRVMWMDVNSRHERVWEPNLPASIYGRPVV
jgi:hypothetical protein